MPETSATLHLICGKIASGKSTLASELAASEATILVAEDAWLASLFLGEMSTAADYLRCSVRLRAAMGPHVTALLNAGLSVVLDFPANTVETRTWMRGILAASGAAHAMHVLEASDALCLARLRARNAQGDHAFAATEAQFHRFTSHHAPPAPEEGFHLVRHAQS